MLKNILVAIDGSPCAEDARQYAVRLALKLRAQLEAVHVVDSRQFMAPSYVAGGHSPVPLVYPAATAREIQQLLKERGELCLREAENRSREEGVELATSLLWGHPAQLLAELQARTELLVLGRHGEHAAAESGTTGSTTDRVVRRACRPCLVVPPGAPAPTRLLVATDGSENAYRAAHVAFELANALEAPLVILAVAEKSGDLAAAQANANETHRLARAHECAAGTIVREGPSAVRILEEAAQTGSNLLVVGSHGHGWIYERLIGGTAAHLLAHSTLPLLLVR